MGGKCYILEASMVTLIIRLSQKAREGGRERDQHRLHKTDQNVYTKGAYIYIFIQKKQIQLQQTKYIQSTRGLP